MAPPLRYGALIYPFYQFHFASGIISPINNMQQLLIAFRTDNRPQNKKSNKVRIARLRKRINTFQGYNSCYFFTSQFWDVYKAKTWKKATTLFVFQEQKGLVLWHQDYPLLPTGIFRLNELIHQPVTIAKTRVFGDDLNRKLKGTKVWGFADQTLQFHNQIYFLLQMGFILASGSYFFGLHDDHMIGTNAIKKRR